MPDGSVQIVLRWYPALFSIACFGTVVLLRSWLVRKRTGIERAVAVRPRTFALSSLLVLSQFALQAAMGVQIVLFTMQRASYDVFGRVDALESPWMGALGVVLTLCGWGWMWFSQSHLGESWRIGIDECTDNVLKTNGFYRFSRHPIFTGLMAVQIGLFCQMPTIASALVVLGYALVLEIEMRREEAYLLRQHGEAYQRYMLHSGRWLPRLGAVAEQVMTIKFEPRTVEDKTERRRAA